MGSKATLHRLTFHQITLQIIGLLSMAGLGFMSQEAQARADIPTPDPDLALGEALAPALQGVEIPAPSAQTTEPKADTLAPQPLWAPGADETVITAAAIAPPTPADLPVVAPEEMPLAAAEPAPGEFAVIDTEAIKVKPVDPSLAPPSTDAAGELAPIAEAPPAVVGGNGSELASAATPTAPVTVPLADPVAEASPSVQPSQAAVAVPLSAAPSPELAAAPTAAVHLPPPGLPSSPKAPRTPTVAPRPAVSEMATLRARAETITALLQDIRAAAGLDANVPSGSATAITPRRQVTPPETLNRGPQLPPIPSQSAPRRPLRSALEATDKPVKDGVTLAQGRREPQLPILPRLAAQPNVALANVALALPAPQPAMAPELTAQADPATPRPVAIPVAIDPESVRDDLRIDPLTTVAPTTYIPSSSAGIPTGFGAEWGDFFISATLAGADRVRPEADGSLYMGFGLGDARRLVGVEIAYNLLSIRRFAENGSFDAKVHREIYNQGSTQVAGAVGVTSAFPYGSNAIGTEASVYGVVSSAHLLQPDHPTNPLTLNTTLGLGSGNFANGDVGILAGVGLRAHPQFAINTAWSGVGVNVGASIVPSANLPITLNLLYGDIFNNTTAGSVAVISIGYGINSNARF